MSGASTRVMYSRAFASEGAAPYIIPPSVRTTGGAEIHMRDVPFTVNINALFVAVYTGALAAVISTSAPVSPKKKILISAHNKKSIKSRIEIANVRKVEDAVKHLFR